MGYTTEFEGEFTINRELDQETYDLLMGLATTRRMGRDPELLAERIGLTVEEVIQKYGKECQFWSGDERFTTNDVININTPPTDQPGLYLQWIPGNDRKSILWDGNEKFYNAFEWIEYLIKYILAPRGYVLNGTIDAYGEDRDDNWAITIKDNVARRREKILVYADGKDE